MANRNNLKALHTKKSGLEQEVAKLNKQQKKLTNEIAIKLSQLNNTKKKIDEIGSQGIVVSEHAILRYLQRVKSMDIEALSEEIVPKRTSCLIQKSGSGRYEVDDYILIVNNGVVTTITGTSND